MDWLFHAFRIAIALFQVFYFLITLIGRGLLFSWPISLVLLAVLISEFPHAPKKWESRFNYALVPLGIQGIMLVWAVMSLPLPILKLFVGGLGMNLAMGALFVQILAAIYAWKKIDGYRCFFLALMLNEIWVGFWSSIIAAGILTRPW